MKSDFEPTAEQITAALRCCGNTDTKKPDCEHCPLLSVRMCVKVMLEGAADMIVQLNDFDQTQSKIALERCQRAEKQLAESQRREQAAVEDLSGICGQIDDDEYLRKAFCIHPGNEDCPSEKENGYVDVDDCVGCPLFENSWRGPQDGKGEAE